MEKNMQNELSISNKIRIERLITNAIDFCKSKNSDQTEAFFKQHNVINEKEKAKAGYALARYFCSEDRLQNIRQSGHFGIGNSYFPFVFAGWGGEDGYTSPVYKINPDCFNDVSSVKFIYYDEDMRINSDIYDTLYYIINCSEEQRNKMKNEADSYYIKNILETKENIEKFSSGIGNLQLIQINNPTFYNEGNDNVYYAFLFEMNEKYIKDKIFLNGEIQNTEKIGKYFFCIPHGGEFECYIDEIKNNDINKRVRLVVDDFCCK
jgi:hypothetical protein